MSTSGSDTLFPLWMCLLAGFIVFGIVSSVRRRKAMRLLAARIGFTYLGQTLPASLDSVGTIPTRASGFSNVIDGELKGIRVVAFDYRRGSGKNSYLRTAIAAQTDRDLFACTTSERSLTTERSEGWIVLYPTGGIAWPNGLVPVSELEAWLEAFG